MKPSEFIHPEDAAALRQLESIPGFPTLVKKFYALGVEKLMYGTNMASNIRLSEISCRNFTVCCPRYAAHSVLPNRNSISR